MEGQRRQQGGGAAAESQWSRRFSAVLGEDLRDQENGAFLRLMLDHFAADNTFCLSYYT